MTETQKDFERLEREKFELLAWTYPWRANPKPHGKINFCLGSTEACKQSDCAVWHFVKAVT